nr:hypothetical protein [Corynebacterium lactis]
MKSTAKGNPPTLGKAGAGAVGLVSLLALGLGACSSTGPSGQGTPSSSVTTGTASRAAASTAPTGEAAPAGAKLRDSLANIAADTSTLKDASATLIGKGDVSEPTVALAQRAMPILEQEESRLVQLLGVGVEPTLAGVDSDALGRLNNETGPHADMAYLTLLESGLDSLISRWRGIDANGDQSVADLAGSATRS